MEQRKSHSSRVMLSHRLQSRTLANRQSARRSKERKAQYIAALKRRVQILQTESTILKTHISMIKRNCNELTMENTALRLELKSVDQLVYYQYAKNDALQAEIHRIQMSQFCRNVGAMMHHFYNHNYVMQPQFPAQELQLFPEHQPTVLQGHQPQLQQPQTPANLKPEDDRTNDFS